MTSLFLNGVPLWGSILIISGGSKFICLRCEDETTPMFTRCHRGHELHTHTPINHLVYHFRPGELWGENRAQMALTAASASIWLAFTQKAAKEALKKMTLNILGGKIARK
jgi:hypothetical protein